MKIFLLCSWIIISIFLLFYSFTQVDLSLTLSQVSIWQSIQKGFQWVGYFNRPLSTSLYLFIITGLFLLYGVTLRTIVKNVVDRRLVLKVIFLVSVILFFSYNAFSYDIFNYIFDAKIFTHYQDNPYQMRALDYPEDPMLSFMHWTHRTYPYGPVWLGISIPLSFLGFGYFLLTFYLFKSIALISYLASVFLIERIAIKMGREPILPMAAFALNPLVLVESLVSAHNDIVMIALSLLGILFYLERKLIKSFISLSSSILVKYATALVIPAIMLKGIFRVSNNIFFYTLIVSMTVGVILASYRTNFQPWYLLYIIPFASFMIKKYNVAIPVFTLSIAGLLHYVPYLYLGNWNQPVPEILNMMILVSIFVSVIFVVVRFFQNKSLA